MEISNIRCLLLDLDDTLVACSPFVRPFFAWKLCRSFAGHISAIRVLRGLKSAKARMHAKPQDPLNFEYLVESFAKDSGASLSLCKDLFEKQMPQVLSACKPFFSRIEMALHFIKGLDRRYALVLATNPLWPEYFMHARLTWGSVESRRFSLITHSQNMHYCKPRNEYYHEILNHLYPMGIKSSECLMIGNDVINDGAAVESGIQTALLTRRANQLKVVREPTKTSATIFEASWPVLFQHFGVKQ